MNRQVVEAITEIYLLAKGVRDVAVVYPGREGNEKFESFLRWRLALPPSMMGCFPVKFIRSNNDSFIIYRAGYKQQALELRSLFGTGKPNHGRVGEILGYHPDIIYRGV